jgi:hypothetical protein
MEIFPERGRIVIACMMSADPVRYAPMAMSYVDVREGLIRTQRRPDSLWTDDFYRIEGDSIFWNHDGGYAWPWQAISREQLPDWFDVFQAKVQASMDKRETAFRPSQSQAAQNGAGNSCASGPDVL